VDVDFKRAEKLVNIETPKTKTRRAPTVQVGLFGEDEEGIAV
jgi:hypothetical protein